MREYRQDSHTAPLAAWTVLCLAAAAFFFVHAQRITNRVLAAEEVVAAAGLLVVGPIALAVYLYRARHVWVAIDQTRGLVVSGRRVIPWEAIVRVERRRPRLRKGSGPAEMGRVGDLSPGCIDLPGCGVGGGEIGAAVLGILVVAVAAFFVLWLVVFVAIPLFVIPWLEVFAPFGDRIRIVLHDGRPLVLRDLRGADEFMMLLPASVPR
jgi:hypothetical protein